MNSKDSNSIIHMEKDELLKLVKEVKETVATGESLGENAEKHVFSAADLWRIRNMRKTTTGLSKKWENNF